MTDDGLVGLIFVDGLQFATQEPHERIEPLHHLHEFEQQHVPRMSQTGMSLLMGEDATAVLFVVADADGNPVHEAEWREVSPFDDNGVALPVAQAQSAPQSASQKDTPSDEAREGDDDTYYIDETHPQPLPVREGSNYSIR